MDETPVTSFYFLLKETSVRLKHLNVIEDICRFSEEWIIPLWKQEKLADNSKYILSFVGLTNVGKSTLITALLGYKIAPYENRPTTAIPVEYVYAPTWRIKILNNSFDEKVEVFSNERELAEAVKMYVLYAGPEAVKTTLWVTVEGPLKILEKGLVLADTPGFGDAQIGDDDLSIQRRRDKLIDFINKRVHSVYFCVSGIDWFIRDEEKKIYDAIRHCCRHIVVNKWEFNENDLLSEKEVTKYKQKYAPLFPGCEFIFVNAKNALIGNNEGVTIEKKSNIDYLKSLIKSYSSSEERKKIIMNDLCKLWKNFNRFMEVHHNLKEIPWRIDSLKRFFHSCRNYKELLPIKEDIVRLIK